MEMRGSISIAMIKLPKLRLVSYSQAKNHLLFKLEAIQTPGELTNLKKLLMGDFIPYEKSLFKTFGKLNTTFEALFWRQKE